MLAESVGSIDKTPVRADTAAAGRAAAPPITGGRSKLALRARTEIFRLHYARRASAARPNRPRCPGGFICEAGRAGRACWLNLSGP